MRVQGFKDPHYLSHSSSMQEPRDPLPKAIFHSRQKIQAYISRQVLVSGLATASFLMCGSHKPEVSPRGKTSPIEAAG